MNTQSIVCLALIISTLSFTNCAHTAGKHYDRLGTTEDENFTLGNVQKRIQTGMSQADVVTALGSPNIVTKDSSGFETWVYDKMASEVLNSESSRGTWLIFYGSSGSDSASKTRKRTLTVVIKFDKNQNVKDLSYHSSSF